MGHRQAPERIELIEVLDPASPFGGRGHAGGADPGPVPTPATGPTADRRWARTGVALGLAGAVAVCTALAWGANDPAPPPRAAATTSAAATGTATIAPPPSTTTPLTGRSATTTPLSTSPIANVTSQHPEARLLGTAPTGMTLEWVSESPADVNDDVNGDVNDDGRQVSAALWADGAHADPGVKWLQVTTTPEALGPALGTGQLRVATSHGVGTVRSTIAGLTVTAPIDGGSATVQASGIDVADLVAVLDGLGRTDAGIQLDPTALPAHLTLRGSTAAGERVWTPTYATSSFSGSGSAYIGSPNATPRLQVDVGPPPTGFADASADFFLTGATGVAVAGGEGRIGTDQRLEADPRRMTFVRDGLTVTLTAWGVSDDALVAHANSIRLYSDPGWTRLESDLQGADDGSAGDVPDARALPLAAGSLAASADGTWSVDYRALADQPDRLGLTVSVVPDHYGWTLSIDTVARHRPSLAATVTADQTFVVALVPTGVGAVVVRITVAGAVVDTVAFSDVEGLDNRAAVAVFTDVGPYVAEIVGADGSVLAEYDPTVAPPAVVLDETGTP